MDLGDPGRPARPRPWRPLRTPGSGCTRRSAVVRDLRRQSNTWRADSRRGCGTRGGAGDVVAFQLPNWMEAAATFWASSFLGAVVVPIVHFYGRKELGHILKTDEPKVFITAEEFGRMRTTRSVRDVPIVGVVGRDFDDLLADEPMRARSTPTRRTGCDRVHLGDHPRPQGCRAQPPDTRIRNPPTQCESPGQPGGTPWRFRSGTSSGCSVGCSARCSRVCRSTCATHGTRPGAGADESDGVDSVAAQHISSPACSTTPTSPKTIFSTCVPRPGRVGGSRGGDASGHRPRTGRDALLRQYRASVHHRFKPDGTAG